MFWVIQNNLYNEYGYVALKEALDRMELPYICVKIDESGLVMVMGSLTLAKIAAKRNWVPGSFNNENFDYKIWNGVYKDYCLNHISVVDKLRNINKQWDKFFIRPCEDSKAFSGTIMTWDEFDSWRKGILAIENDMWILDGDTEVMMSPLTKIYNETRFFVVDGKLVTYSEYKSGDRVHYSHDIVSPSTIEFAQSMVNMWQPSRAFVIDIADTPNGYKVIEINCFNSAGFYDCNVFKIVEAVERMIF